MTPPNPAPDAVPPPPTPPEPVLDAGIVTARPRPRSLVALHWLTALALVGAATLILVRGEVDGRALRQWLLEGHRHFGLLVLMLFCLRVAVRLRLGRLQAPVGMGWIIRAAAALTHVAMYALLLSLPLLGWALSDALAKPVHLFGLSLPTLVEPDPDLADTLQAWHLDAAWALLALVTLHVGAALWHHFIRRDAVLRDMLPQRRRD
ncbi:MULTISPECIES: cytochrome b/b6 domain-containing protein [unclassified Pseudoxanthomonas]|uniref:cytochrome b n=1 Tax=unclassified Pseudoxanthomonas TaxID=2645906 RepID=UPI0030769266